MSIDTAVELRGDITVIRHSDRATIGCIRIQGNLLEIVAYGSDDLGIPKRVRPIDDPRALNLIEAAAWIEANTGVVDPTRDDPNVVLVQNRLFRIVYRVAGGGVLAFRLMRSGRVRTDCLYAIGGDGQIVADLCRDDDETETVWWVNVHGPASHVLRYRGFQAACEALADATLGAASSAHDKILREEQKAAESALWDGPNPPVPPVTN